MSDQTQKHNMVFTLDLEDHRPDETLPLRYPLITRKILTFLKDRNIKGTFFIVGTLAENDPGIIRDIAENGHEIALHSYDHTPIPNQTPEQFKDHTRRGKDILEDIIGEQIIGYRAPIFSLTRDCLWAPDILKELGFTYSSSVSPAKTPFYDLKTAPQHPFQWPNGLLEFPVPVSQIGPFTLPYLGGIYCRYLPFWLIQQKIRTAPKRSDLWTYWHPYDFDAEEKNWRIKDAPTWVSLLLWLNRKNSFDKLVKLTEHPNIEIRQPFKQQIENGRFQNLPVFQATTG